MSYLIAGIFWNRNEADILEETITAAVEKCDVLLMADDGSTDNSYDIMKSCKARFPEIIYLQRSPNKNDPAQRNALLNEVRKRFKPEDTFVQVCESDIFLMTDPREAIKNNLTNDLGITWVTLNGVRKYGTWKEVDTYPEWGNVSIKSILPYCHVLETMLYTYRPLKDLYYTNIWRPWPSGFSKYLKGKSLKSSRRALDSPLLFHAGYRGPTHFYEKYKSMGSRHKRYKNWDLTSIEAVERTVSFFNNTWNKNPFPVTVEGYQEWVRGRTA